MRLGAFDKNLTKTRIAQLRLNMVTLPTYWAIYPDLSGQARRAAQLRSWGLEVVGHPIVYGMKPDWPDTVATEEQVRDRMAAYWDLQPMTIVDVVNEPFHHPVLSAANYFVMYGLYRMQFDRRVNEYGILTGEITDMLVGALRGVPEMYERLGVQAHVLAGEAPYATVWQIFTVRFMRDQLERLRVLEKPLDLSEISIPSSGNGWTETRQRDFLSRLRDASAGLVDTMSWWEVQDSADMWNPRSGLYRANGSAKPALTTWRALAGETPAPENP